MATTIVFHVLPHGKKLPRPATGPALILYADNWNDYSHVTQFDLNFMSESGVQTYIGQVKILEWNEQNPEEAKLSPSLPSKFTSLTDAFVSLGQGDEYYVALRKVLGKSGAKRALSALRDGAMDPSALASFEPTDAYRLSLTRGGRALRSIRFGRTLIETGKVSENLRFTYQTKFTGAVNPISITLDFDPKDPLPGRIIGIVGRNAVGKTRVLANLATDLATPVDSGTKGGSTDKDNLQFPGGRPLFSRVIALSYSPFDEFSRPNPQALSYVYCGIRSPTGGFSRKNLLNTYLNNLSRIRGLQREASWVKHMTNIFGNDEFSPADFQVEIESEAAAKKNPSIRSSGQAILSHFVAAILSWVQPNSLLLFDEPETHLHPNAVANLFNVLTDILKEFDSYALIATHSPLVIQEIPTKRVLHFQRHGNTASSELLRFESFGENIGEITRHIFETDQVNTQYKETLRCLLRKRTPAQVLDLFDRGLSLNARAFLLSVAADHEDAE